MTSSSTDLRDRLQLTFGAAYTIERELGGGGMSRVFRARDDTLGRDVVIKVLTSELAQELSAERFDAREEAPASWGVNCDPMFDPLKSDPRFGVLMARMNVHVCPPGAE
jgi:serine/threonine protein kinase